jgi:Bacterial PH domain
VSSSQDSHSSSGGGTSHSPDAPVAGAAPAARPKVFRSPGAVAVWYVWLVFAGLNMIDLAVQGHDHTSAVVAATLVLITGAVFVAALRPRIFADEDGVTVRNPMRDIRVPWGAVTSIDLQEMVRVHCRANAGETVAGAEPRQRVLHSWALQSSRRSRMKAQLRARTRTAEIASGRPGFTHAPAEVHALMAQSTAAWAVTSLDELRASAAQRGALGGPPEVRWSAASAAALLLPALLLAVVSVIS